MVENYSTPKEIRSACDAAKALAPEAIPPDLPQDPAINGEPRWYSFEHDAWRIGERIRQSFQTTTRLKRDPVSLAAVMDVVRFRNLRRGRQSFVLALGFTAAASYAQVLAAHLDDPDIDGQVLHTLLKMRAPGLAAKVEPFIHAKHAWMRRLAQRYIEKFAPAI